MVFMGTVVLDLLVNLIKSMSVVIVLAYVTTRTKAYADILSEERIKPRQQLLLMVVFGVFSIFGTLSGINLMGAIVTIRDMGPAIAGLIGGPLAGLGAGLLGGIHRWFVGGVTAVPSSLTTVLVGMIAGLIYQFRKGQFLGMTGSVIFMAIMEMFLMGLSLVIVKPISVILPIVETAALPMILINALGMGLFAFIFENLMHERETRRAKETIENELGVARKIQMSIVPKIFPAFPERREIDIHALLEPAREVGGDLYDYFLLDDDHLCFTIGDVSGKGVPASLFMAVTKTLIKAKSGVDMNPDQVLSRVNNELCKDNDSGMFVTILLGVLTLSTGELIFSNAGHNSPCLHRTNGTIEFLPKLPGMALAVLENIRYASAKLTLQRGDRLVLFTDGVTEAMNRAGELLKNERLISMLETCPGTTARETSQFILDQTRLFANGAAQSDDITLLVIRYNGI